MGLAFYVLQFLALCLGIIYVLQRLFSRNRGRHSAIPGFFFIAFVLGMIIAVAFPMDVRFFGLEHFRFKVASVDGPNMFTVKVGRRVPLVLYDTVPPSGPAEAQKAEQFLRDRIVGKKIAIDFPTKDKKLPRPAVIIFHKANLNEIMISEGLLQRGLLPAAGAPAGPGAAPPTASGAVVTPPGQVSGASPAAAAREPAKRRSPVVRFAFWILAGIIGASLFGQVLIGRKSALVLLLLLVLFAVRDIALSAKAGASLLPPIIGLAIVVVFGPSLRSAVREARSRMG